MKVKEVNFWFWFVKKLPKKLIYFCFLWVMCHATTGKYGNTLVGELTGMDALKRYEKDYNIEG